MYGLTFRQGDQIERIFDQRMIDTLDSFFFKFWKLHTEEAQIIGQRFFHGKVTH
jgi:hypothetical protein